jgi:hypothetical protein
MTDKTTILHISDLHIEADAAKQFDRSMVLGPLLEGVVNANQAVHYTALGVRPG